MRCSPRILQRIILYSFFGVTIATLSLFVFPKSEAHAQTLNNYSNYNVSQYTQPNVDPDVPLNQHTFVQATLIEMLSASICQLTGIDVVNPRQSCLGIDLKTGKLGYAPPGYTQKNGQIGGILGDATHMVAIMYTPTTSTADYFRYLSSNFGIVKKAYAADGFASLNPIMNLWRASRNIAYATLILAFIFIGVGIMLRIKIDPRTVMTIQNQVPRVIIAILLITFSYAIVAVMIDLMWTVTYVGINALTNTANTPFANPQGCAGQPLSQAATNNLLSTPIAYVNEVFKKGCTIVTDSGLGYLTDSIAGAIGSILAAIVSNVLGVVPGQTCFDFGQLILGNGNGFNWQSCVADFVGFFFHILMLIIVIIVIIIMLFRVWFELLKAYLFILFYTISAPIWIVFGLLPGRPLGFNKWIRTIFVNLAVFPLVALIFVGARVLMEVLNNNKDPNNSFIPPLVGNPNMNNFGSLIAFGAILMAPTILSQLRDAMKVQQGKGGAAMGAGIAAGAAVIAAPTNRGWSHLNRRNPQTGEGIGYFARKQTEAGNKALGLASKFRIPGAQSALDKRTYMAEQGLMSLRGYNPKAFKDKRAQEAAEKAQRPLKQKFMQHWLDTKGLTEQQLASSEENKTNFATDFTAFRDKGLALYRQEKGYNPGQDINVEKAFKHLNNKPNVVQAIQNFGNTGGAPTPTPSSKIILPGSNNSQNGGNNNGGNRTT